jgi:hypothetical protein
MRALPGSVLRPLLVAEGSTQDACAPRLLLGLPGQRRQTGERATAARLIHDICRNIAFSRCNWRTLSIRSSITPRLDTLTPMSRRSLSIMCSLVIVEG